MKDCVYNPPFRMIYHAVFYPTLFENPPKGRIITFILHIWRFLGRITILPIGGYLHTFTFYRVGPRQGLAATFGKLPLGSFPSFISHFSLIAQKGELPVKCTQECSAKNRLPSLGSSGGCIDSWGSQLDDSPDLLIVCG